MAAAVVILRSVRLLVVGVELPPSDLGVDVPVVESFDAVAVTVDAGSERGVYAADAGQQLGGLFGKEEVSAVGYEFLQGFDGGFIGKFRGQITKSYAYPVNMDPDTFEVGGVYSGSLSGSDYDSVGMGLGKPAGSGVFLEVVDGFDVGSADQDRAAVSMADLSNDFFMIYMELRGSLKIRSGGGSFPPCPTARHMTGPRTL